MYNNIIQAPSFYRVGIYIRLSESDEDKTYESDSESVTNQKEILRDYCLKNGFNLIDEYVDDGYSGTNFDRPGFMKMIEDIKNKKKKYFYFSTGLITTHLFGSSPVLSVVTPLKLDNLL